MLVRVLAAAVRACARVSVSVSAPLPPALHSLLEASSLAGAGFSDAGDDVGVPGVVVETDAAFSARVVEGRPERIRLIGSDGLVAGSGESGREVARGLFAALEGSPDVAVFAGPVTAAGRVELLPFLREQAVSLTAHRFGNPYPALGELKL